MDLIKDLSYILQSLFLVFNSHSQKEAITLILKIKASILTLLLLPNYLNIYAYTIRRGLRRVKRQKRVARRRLQTRVSNEA